MLAKGLQRENKFHCCLLYLNKRKEQVMRMGVCENLEPKRVFAYFEEICKIPHGSGNTKAISDYCVSFAK